METIWYWLRVFFRAMRLWRRPLYPGDPPTDWGLAWVLAQTLVCIEDDGWRLLRGDTI